MTDTPETSPLGETAPSPEDVAKWTAAINEIMERDGVTAEQANAGLVWALVEAKIQEDIAQLNEDHDTEAREALWASVIADLQERFPAWTEQECNDNLINLLKWVEAHPGDEYTG